MVHGGGVCTRGVGGRQGVQVAPLPQPCPPMRGAFPSPRGVIYSGYSQYVQGDPGPTRTDPHTKIKALRWEGWEGGWGPPQPPLQGGWSRHIDCYSTVLWG